VLFFKITGQRPNDDPSFCTHAHTHSKTHNECIHTREDEEERRKAEEEEEEKEKATLSTQRLLSSVNQSSMKATYASTLEMWSSDIHRPTDRHVTFKCTSNTGSNPKVSSKNQLDEPT